MEIDGVRQCMAAQVERVAVTLEAAGMKVVHRGNRIAGSTVISVEDATLAAQHQPHTRRPDRAAEQESKR